MKEEYLRLVHAEGNGWKDVNLTLIRGEIVFLADPGRDGARVFKDWAEGKTGRMRGSYFLRGEKIPGSWFPGPDAVILDGTMRYSGAVSVAQNLYGVGPEGGFFRGKRRIGRLADAALVGAGLEISPHRPVWELNPFEQTLLGLADAWKKKAGILILDGTGNSFGEAEYQYLGERMSRLTERGTCVLILADRANPLLEWADRSVLLEDGRDRMVFYEPSKLRRYLEQKRQPGSLPEDTASRGREVPLDLSFSGGITGILAPEWGLQETMPAYLNHLSGALSLPLPFSLDRRRWKKERVAYVPEDSGHFLLEDRTLGENLAAAMTSEITYPWGWVKRGMLSYLAREFAERFSWTGEIPPSGWSASEKKWISICRIAFANPRYLLLEEPLKAASEQEKPVWMGYLSELASEGCRVVLLSRKREELFRWCDTVIEVSREQEIGAKKIALRKETGRGGR
ncbi:hypothetical protein MUB23_10650 [Cuneatibacter sp. NSJ-177]|uniref:hypothetical protein n=1 Tax=Cuneatibacter sp. NSJ-177 TaxID=2931401 RepID=UPI001FCFD47A|nr:hypothetical protein [Cuneatibacter sp. NSJ-177]MCJ7835844.1 hypothetical protein [Cuneatibacter sp. NSJ-177]